jgi:hypothetical protein
MATYLHTALRDWVAEDLTVKDANEALSAEDAVAIDKRIQSKLEELNEDGLLPFDLDGDELPARYMVPLSQVLCPIVAPLFGKAAQDYLQVAQIGMRSLHRLKAKPYYGSVAPATYY